MLINRQPNQVDVRLREYTDKWALLLFLAVVFFLSLDLSAIYPSMNALQVAGVIFNVVLTIGLLTIYLEMSDTQDQQRQIMDQQESLMAANHAPRIQVYHHDILMVDEEEHSVFVVTNEGEGSAENLKAGCNIYLGENTDTLPFFTSIESYNIHSFPRQLIRIEEDESLVELSGSPWLGQNDVAAFHGWMTFYEMDLRQMQKQGLEQLETDSEVSTEVDGGLVSFKDLKNEIPFEEADIVYIEFYIEYEYGDGREDKKKAPIYALTPEEFLDADTLSGAIDEGEWITHLPTGFWSANDRPD